MWIQDGWSKETGRRLLGVGCSVLLDKPGERERLFKKARKKAGWSKRERPAGMIETSSARERLPSLTLEIEELKGEGASQKGGMHRPGGPMGAGEARKREVREGEASWALCRELLGAKCRGAPSSDQVAVGTRSKLECRATHTEKLQS